MIEVFCVASVESVLVLFEIENFKQYIFNASCGQYALKIIVD